MRNYCECGLTAWQEFGSYWVAMVDAEHSDLLALGFKVITGGARSLPKRLAKTINGRTVILHRQILRVETGVIVDHLNGNPLDNRVANLRIVSKAENNRNRRSQHNATYRLKGVHLHRPGVWRAVIDADGKRHSLGVFKTPEEAAAAYDEAARRLHGEHAKTNLDMGLLRSKNRTNSSMFTFSDTDKTS